MLVADLSDQLGNQMFAYASVKTIAMQKGYEFRFVRTENTRINDNDSRYGCEVYTIFPQTRHEFLPSLPSAVDKIWRETITPGSTRVFSKDALKVSDNTYMKGHFISCLYFKDHLSEVRQWFAFSEDLLSSCHEKIRHIQETHPGKRLVAVHFRVGDDYLKQGFLLQSSYWFRAAEYILQKYGRDQVIFLPFYDYRPKSGRVVNRFMKKYPCQDMRGSLVEDMCSMSLLSDLIICNSSFSAMAGLLNSVPNVQVLRPSVYPSGTSCQPTDCFPEEWTVISARRSIRSWFAHRLMLLKGKILKLIR